MTETARTRPISAARRLMLCVVCLTALWPSPCSAERSVRLNNYNNWHHPRGTEEQIARQMDWLTRRDRICMNEPYSVWGRLAPEPLKNRNPRAKIYAVYALCVKNKLDSDWDNPDDSSRLGTPLAYADITANDWWLRYGNGEIIQEMGTEQEGRNWFLDVGKPGLKEAFLDTLLSRLEGQGYDGVVFDYWWPSLSWVCRNGSRPSAYPTERDWLEKAWKPFIMHIFSGLRKSGYEIVVNCFGTPSEGLYQSWAEPLIQGRIYESWAVGWNGEWLSPQTIQNRMRDFSLDALEAWTADYGLRITDPDFERKAELSLAMYYLALPDEPSGRKRRFFHYYRDMSVFWDPLWDIDIGEPVGSVSKLPGRYFWHRQFTKGTVFLNYEPDKTVAFPVKGRLKDSSGKQVSGEVIVSPHTGMILVTEQ